MSGVDGPSIALVEHWDCNFISCGDTDACAMLVWAILCHGDVEAKDKIAHSNVGSLAGLGREVHGRVGH